MVDPKELKHVMVIQYTKVIGKYYEIPMVAVFDDRQISADNVKQHITSGRDSNKYIAILPEDTFVNVFRNGRPLDN